MRLFQRFCYFFLFLFILISNRPAAAVPDQCVELVPLPDTVDACSKQDVSWQSLPIGETPVCSGAWEYREYTTCVKEDPACGAGYCDRYLYFTVWKNREYKTTTTFNLNDKYRCGGFEPYSYNDGTQLSNGAQMSNAPVGIHMPPGGWNCFWEPDYEGANNDCHTRLNQLSQYFDSEDRQLISANYTGPTIVSHNNQDHATEFQCKFTINYKQKEKLRFCAEWKYPECELHGPDYCDDAQFIGRHYSEHGLTEQQLMNDYALSEYHACTTYEQVSDPEQRYEDLIQRLFAGPLPEDPTARQELIEQIVRQLMINIELDNQHLTRAHRDEIEYLIEEYPGIAPTCGLGSTVIGTCGSIEPLDSLLNFCTRLTNRHTRDKGIHIDHKMLTCNGLLANAIEEAMINRTNGCVGEAWLPYIDEAERILKFLIDCRDSDGGPGDEIPCKACDLRSLL